MTFSYLNTLRSEQIVENLTENLPRDRENTGNLIVKFEWGPWSDVKSVFVSHVSAKVDIIIKISYHFYCKGN